MGAEVIDFYTIGLPRTRSLWLSEFLSYGNSECFHEHLSVHSGQVRPDVSVKYRGFCDTNPLIDIDYGDSPVLIVNRDIDSIVKSAVNNFNCPDGISCFESFLRSYLSEYKSALESRNIKNSMTVDFNDLGDKSTLIKICQFLMPENFPKGKYVDRMILTKIVTTNKELTQSLLDTAKAYGVTYDEYISRYQKQSVECRRLYDYELAVLTMNAVWDEIAEDGAESYTPDLVSEYWVGVYSDDRYIGMYRIHQLTSALWEGHAFILPESRSLSIDAGKAIFNWVVENIVGIEKMIVNIPECFGNVINYVKNLGFSEQGYNSKSYRKGGLIGVYQYGITTEEMKEVMI